MHYSCSLKTESDITYASSNVRVTHIEWKPIRLAASHLLFNSKPMDCGWRERTIFHLFDLSTLFEARIITRHHGQCIKTILNSENRSKIICIHLWRISQMTGVHFNECNLRNANTIVTICRRECSFPVGCLRPYLWSQCA